MWLANLFFHSIGEFLCLLFHCLFTLFKFLFVQGLFNLMLSHMLIFLFVPCTFGIISKKVIAETNVRKVFSCLFLEVSDLTLKSLINFEFVFMWWKIRVQFHSFSCGYPVSPTPFIGETVISIIVYSWHPCQRSIDYTCLSLFMCSLFCNVGLYVCFYASTILFWLL